MMLSTDRGMKESRHSHGGTYSSWRLGCHRMPPTDSIRLKEKSLECQQVSIRFLEVTAEIFLTGTITRSVHCEKLIETGEVHPRQRRDVIVTCNSGRRKRQTRISDSELAPLLSSRITHLQNPELAWRFKRRPIGQFVERQIPTQSCHTHTHL